MRRLVAGILFVLALFAATSVSWGQEAGAGAESVTWESVTWEGFGDFGVTWE
ncbi:MAG: hypothetical protein QN141_03580 [Armatimonadota bacterium]|nr:hypothetical protein [Armatimonadota bacterium]MDR7451425.1 hypothetical protein [Armatimonadota bacterium]MDR7466425.1 hypothetical protein [Armatimonadota bacterium]MDR7493147.1 hypothetical protein [Armatimonadota bacterium]MDR7500336.1 hypothetical protein [Armatimonadota bacterium]